jgi:trigger factor
VGARIGADVTGSVTFGDKARTASVAGLTLDVTLKVLSIQRYTVPTLSDALAEQLGFAGGAEGMRTAMAGQIRDQREMMARNQARANLLEVLIKANRFDVPASMVEQSLSMLVEELKQQQSYRTGRDPRTITFGDAQMADLRIRAEFAAKSALILEFVHKKESIVVTDADLEAKYQEFADSRGQTVEAVKGWFTKDGAVSELKDRILEEKTLDWLLERANPVAPDAATTTTSTMQAVAEQMVKDEVEKKAKSSKSKAEAAPAAVATTSEADLSVLKGAVNAIKDAVASGAHDADLKALLDAELAGKNRKGAVQAIEARIAELGEPPARPSPGAPLEAPLFVCRAGAYSDRPVEPT